MIVPIILAGGTGSRLWPLSRSAYPKQLLPLVSNHTLLQETLLRLKVAEEKMGAPLVICNEAHRFLIVEQLKQIDIVNAHILLEPVGKNTAPAVTLAALFLLKYCNLDPLMLVLPADHVIQNIESFHQSLLYAKENALHKNLVTFGIKPHLPETGYGYIKTCKKINNYNAYEVLQFVEKPDVKTAQAYLDSGEFYWNSGMFMFVASTLLKEMSKHAPHMVDICRKALDTVTNDLEFTRIDAKIFNECPSDSIDYALMEKTEKAVLVPLDAKWSDVGSWQALWEILPMDSEGNVVQGDVVLNAVSNSYLRAENRMIAAIGLKDHIVVETQDAVLVAHKDHCQAVKEMVNQLKLKKRTEIDLHRRVYRPWGYYEIVDQGEAFQVKRISVKPGASLSLQMHYHRSEHWVVVSGTAEITRANTTFIITANESTYIPAGVKHKLTNPLAINLEIIEVQSGRYLGEDDIVRFEALSGQEV